MTTRLGQAIEVLGLATCGELGARLGKRLGIQTSPTTILRRIMAVPTPPPGAVSALGIDDFALLRGRRYGTILIDLSRHQVIDLLPDRQAETAAAWMKPHTEIELVSRDRGGDYAAAARQGAPQAIQIADRFHVCKNLTEAVEKVLARCRAEIRKNQRVKEKTAEAPVLQAPAPALLMTDGKPYSAHQRERYDRYQQAMALRVQGVTVKEIAHCVGLGRRTIQRWLAEGTYVETQYHHPHRSRFDAYEVYVRQRWEEGEQNIQQLWREIKAQGYPHSARALRGHLAAAPGPKPADLPAGGVLDHFSAKKAVWLFVRPVEDLLDQEQAELTALRQASATAEALYPPVQAFFRLVRSHQGSQLDEWLTQAAESQIPELQRFARGLEQDKAAVLAGLTRTESNAITEGHVCKLKMIKRLMFGRAGFPLLRQRVLHAV
jgi:transposase